MAQTFDANPAPACMADGPTRDRPIPLPGLKRKLARGADSRIVDIGPALLRGPADDQPQDAYSARLQSLLRAQLLHSRIYGEFGDTAALGLERVKSAVEGDPPDLLIWRLGLDDALGRTPAAKVEALVRASIDAARAAKVEIAVVGLSPFAGEISDMQYTFVARALATAARDRGALFIDRALMARRYVVAGGGSEPARDGPGADRCLPDLVARALIDGVRAARD